MLKISAEERDEPPKVAIITRSGVKTNEDVTTKETQHVPEVRKAKGPTPEFNPQKEKETFMEARREFVMRDTGASTSQLSRDQRQNNDERMVHNMPSIFDKEKIVDKKVSPLKTFLQSIYGLLKDDEAIDELSEIMVQCNK